MPEPEHAASLAVWDLASPVIVGRRATLKVGIACAAGCNLAGTSVEIYNEAGERVAGGMVGSTPWPATAALYWAELDVAPPEGEGDQSWTLHATTPAPTHADATTIVHVVVCRPPEHHVTLEVIDKISGRPLGGVELRLGRFRTSTNDAGIAHLEVPGGHYDVGTWKDRYEVLAKTVEIARETTIHLELAATPEQEQPYWM